MRAASVVATAFGVALVVSTVRAAPPAAPRNVVLLERTATSARLAWTPGEGTVRGFKILPSAVPGQHPGPGLYPGGKLAAFTWTTDDGNADNLVYDAIFAPRGLHFTAFVNASMLGAGAGKLRWEDVAALHGRGHEIANHTLDHLSLIDDRALALRYIGPETCTAAVQGGALRTWVDGVPDLECPLTDPAVDYLVELAAFLDAEVRYECTLLYSALQIPATRSSFLDPVAGLEIGGGAPAETLTTQRGVHDQAEMDFQILGGAAALEAFLGGIDSTYSCRTLSFPNHAHTQWAMSRLNELGYLAARSGPPGELPFFSGGSFTPGFTTSYEVPLNSPRPQNTWDEATTRATYLSRLAAWKANRNWVVLLSHGVTESDSVHTSWMLDEIAADPDVWIATFGEVASFLADYFVDVGAPPTRDGAVSAWLHGLPADAWTHVVVTAYNSTLEESGWSGEVAIPPFGATCLEAAPTRKIGGGVAAVPNPFDEATRFVFWVPRSGPVRVEITDVRGAIRRVLDGGWMAQGEHEVVWDGRGPESRPLPAGVYFYRVLGAEWSGRGKVLHLP